MAAVAILLIIFTCIRDRNLKKEIEEIKKQIKEKQNENITTVGR